MSWILTHVYDATKSPEHLRNAIKIWEKEILKAKKADFPNRTAELYWDIAKAHNLLNEYLPSANNFSEASNFFTLAGEKKPNLSEYYQEYASYMQAWSEFEKGKQAHIEKNYLRAKDHYDKIAIIYDSTKQWKYLASNYRAWASLEEAEEYSKKEQSADAIKSFQEAIDLFKISKNEANEKLKNIKSEEKENSTLVERLSKQLDETESINIKPSSTKDTEIKEQLTKLISASDIRREYCLGRIALEEALVLKKQGEKLDSSRKYGLAAEIFEKIVTDSEESKNEIQQFVCLSNAWQNMTEAEAEASPEKYLEASKLFDNVKDQCKDEKSKRLIQGHSMFCKALEAGTRYEDTGDSDQINKAIQHLGNAANLYRRAGYGSASEYSIATQRFFQAYLYMDNAGFEIDQSKKANLYAMAEKLFESSAKSYLKADYEEKSNEVTSILEGVKVERELAISLGDMLSTTTINPPADSYPVPMPTAEDAVGLEKFESAEIQATLIIGKNEFKVGERLELELEIYNTGKGGAQLLKVEDIFPDEFSINKVPINFRVEGKHLNLRKTALSPQNNEDVRLEITPFEKGVFTIEPRIIYVDESDELASYKVEAIEITVKELGIADWFRGPRRR